MAKTLRINDNSLSDHMHLEDGKLNRKKKAEREVIVLISISTPGYISIPENGML